MKYIITSECIMCNDCLEVCPVSAIVEGDEQYDITSACISCGKCVEVCPVEAIRINIKR